MQDNSSPKITIIILNWNTWYDTIECLECVLKSSYKNYKIVLLDNHSTDKSVDNILNWAEQRQKIDIDTNFDNLVYPLVKKPIKIENDFSNNDALIYLLKNESNLGFAKANNIGINLAVNKFHSDYIFLLNNDTVIMHDAIERLLNFLEDNRNFGAATSLIYNYHDKNKIDNAGGKITNWGTRKYYKKIYRHSDFHRVTFVTGCALMIRKNVIKKYGMLSEKFFFGEEDFEFSFRMKLNNVKMACAYTSIVYHKTSVSSAKFFKGVEKKVFLYGLNRLVNMKDYYGNIKWHIWRYFVLFYFFYLIYFKYKMRFIDTLKFLVSLNNKAHKLKKVDKDTVKNIQL